MKIDWNNFADYIEAFNAVEAEKPKDAEWRLHNVIALDRKDTEPQLQEILRKGAGFNIEPNYLTLINPEILTADEKSFLNQNRKSILCILQMEALARNGLLDDIDLLRNFATDHYNRFSALCELAVSFGSAEYRAIKAMRDTARKWFKLLINADTNAKK